MNGGIKQSNCFQQRPAKTLELLSVGKPKFVVILSRYIHFAKGRLFYLCRRHISISSPCLGDRLVKSERTTVSSSTACDSKYACQLRSEAERTTPCRRIYRRSPSGPLPAVSGNFCSSCFSRKDEGWTRTKVREPSKQLMLW